MEAKAGGRPRRKDKKGGQTGWKEGRVERHRNRVARTQKWATRQTEMREQSQFPRHHLLQDHNSSTLAQGSGDPVSDEPRGTPPPTNELLRVTPSLSHIHVCTHTHTHALPRPT